MDKHLKWGVIGAILCTFLIAPGQMFWKLGAEFFTLNIISIITNFSLMLGFILYGLGALILIASLRFGDVSTLYPIISLSYIWVAILSIFILGETMSTMKWIGVFSIFIGVALIGGSKK